MKFILILIPLATMVACNGGSSTERMANRVLKDALARAEDKLRRVYREG